MLFWGSVLIFYQLVSCIDKISKVILHAFWRSSIVFSILSSFYCPLFLDFVTSPSQGSQMPRENLSCEISFNFILLEKCPSSATFFPFFHSPSGFSYLSNSPRIQWSNSLDVEFDIFRGGIWARADYISVMLFFCLQVFGWKESMPTSAWQSSGPMLPSGPPCPW